MNTIASTDLLNMTESETFDFKSIQYKFYGATDEEKAELLKDIIAFANAWKTGDAFVVIGVSEKNGRKDAVLGVANPLNDNDIQQFANSKTNRHVRFLVYSDKAEGKDINVIQISQDQHRPIFLSKAFGKLKPNEVYVRSGSSTAIASPDQIAEMAKADQQVSIMQANLDFEWVDSTEHRRLGKDVTIKCVKLINPPPEPPKPMRPSIKSDAPPSNPTYLEFIKRSIHANSTPITPTVSLNDGPSAEEVIEYAKALASFAPLRIWLKNLGLRNAASVKVRIHIPRESGVRVIDEGDFPKEPKGRLLSLIGWRTPISFGTHVNESPDGWNVEIDGNTIQPQDEFWSDEKFYLSSDIDRTIETSARIFADDLAKPIEIPLTIRIEVITREMALADLQHESEEQE